MTLKLYPKKTVYDAPSPRHIQISKTYLFNLRNGRARPRVLDRVIVYYNYDGTFDYARFVAYCPSEKDFVGYREDELRADSVKSLLAIPAVKRAMRKKAPVKRVIPAHYKIVEHYEDDYEFDDELSLQIVPEGYKYRCTTFTRKRMAEIATTILEREGYTVTKKKRKR